MPQRNSRRVSKRDSSAVDVLVPLMKRLVQLNEAQTDKMTPDVIDVPRPILSSRKTFTTSLEYIVPITSNSTAENSGAFVFSLSLGSNYVPWTQVFQKFRIVNVSLIFNPTKVVLAANAIGGDIVTAIDTNDGTPAVQEVLSRDPTSMTVPVGQYFERRLTPSIASAVYNGIVASGYAESKGWVDTSSPAVSWYGLKYSQSVSSSAQTPWRVTVIMTVNFKHSK